MNAFPRRNLLRYGTLGSAAALLPGAAFPATTPTLEAEQQQGIFNVRRFGAVGDGKSIDSPAVNRAVEAAAAAGGGTVLFPPGTYTCFSIRLKSFVHLHLMQGCTLLAADSPLPSEQTGAHGGTYDAAEPKSTWDAYQDYGHNHWHNSLIWGEAIHDFSITGPGLIWGKGLSNGRGRPVDGAPFIAEQAGVGNKAIALKLCHNVLLRDFSILKGGHFGLLLTGVDNLTVDNLKIDTDRDGMDIDCCQNVRVSNCTVNSPWDDGICPKSSYALGYARATRNLTIESCFVSGCYELGSVLDGTYRKFSADTHVPRTGRIKCGTESNGGFINITIANCIFEGCQGYALETVDGALLEDISITNTTMRDLVSGPIFLRLGSRLRGASGSTKMGTLRRISISNLDCYNAPARVSSIISGIPGSLIEDISLSNIYIESAGGATAAPTLAAVPEYETKYPEPGMFGQTPAYGFFLRHIRNLQMNHIEVALAKADSRPAMALADVERADFFAITAARGPQGAFGLSGVQDMRVLWSRAAPDTTLAHADNQTL